MMTTFIAWLLLKKDDAEQARIVAAPRGKTRRGTGLPGIVTKLLFRGADVRYRCLLAIGLGDGFAWIFALLD
jgi:hypothetical protein